MSTAAYAMPRVWSGHVGCLSHPADRDDAERDVSSLTLHVGRCRNQQCEWFHLCLSSTPAHSWWMRTTQDIHVLHIDEPSCQRMIGLAWRNDRYLSQMTQKFRQFVIENLARFSTNITVASALFLQSGNKGDADFWDLK